MDNQKLLNEAMRQYQRRKQREQKSIVATAKTVLVWTQYHDDDGALLPEPIEHERPITVKLRRHSNATYSWYFGAHLLAGRPTLALALDYAKSRGWEVTMV